MAALPPGGSAAMGTTLSGYSRHVGEEDLPSTKGASIGSNEPEPEPASGPDEQSRQMNLIDDVRSFIEPSEEQFASQ
jgi:hypothetical protein